MDVSYIQISDEDVEMHHTSSSSYDYNTESSQSPVSMEENKGLKRSLDLYMSGSMNNKKAGVKHIKKKNEGKTQQYPVSIVSYFINSNPTKQENMAVDDATSRISIDAITTPMTQKKDSSNSSTHETCKQLIFKPPKLIEAPVATMLKPVPFDDEMDYKNGLVDQGKIKTKIIPRYGKLYKRKTVGNFGYKCLQSVEGYRFCKFCNANLPLTAFYATTKRYVCRRHHYLRVVKNIYERAKNDEFFYMACYSKRTLASFKYQLGYDKVTYDVSDISKILNHLNKLIPVKSLMPICVPVDYNKQLYAEDNIAFISSRAFKMLMNLHEFVPYKALYIAFVQRMNLIPCNFDTRNLKDPFHDPEYRRKQIDVSVLFSDEFATDSMVGNIQGIADLLNKRKETQDHDIIEEFQKNQDVPWLTEKGISAGEAGLWVDGKPVSDDNNNDQWWEIRSKKKAI